MTLPTVGNSISLGQIRTELGLSGSIGLNATETGIAINQNSAARPDGDSPSTLGEWRGYDHAAGGGPTLYPFTLRYNSSSKTTACSASTATYYSNCSSITTGCYLYSDNEGVSAAFAGWYAAGTLSESVVYESDGAQIYFITTCGA